MKKTIQNLVAIAMIVGLSNNVMAQNTATVNTSASATIIAPITIEKTADMNFGTIIKGAGTVTLSTSGDRTTSYSAFSGTQVGTVNAASFDITGEVGYLYDLTLPGDLDVTLTDGIDGSMSVDTFVSNTTGVLTGGTETVLVGATINVGATQASGSYTGTFDVTVAYN